MVHDYARAGLTVAGGQTPRLFHVLGMDADDRADRVPARRDLGVAQLARPSALADPIGGVARFAVSRRDVDVAAKPDDVSEAQFGEKGEQLGVAEAAIGQDRHRHALGQHLSQAGKTEVLIVVAPVGRRQIPGDPGMATRGCLVRAVGRETRRSRLPATRCDLRC